MKKITEVGVEGTQNILDSMKDNCKIISSSTHVVYEGIKEVKEILENEKTHPILAYGKSKDLNENQLKKSEKNLLF